MTNVITSVGWFVFLTTTIIFFVHASDSNVEEEEQEEEEVPTIEETYHKLHPDLNNVTWPLIDQLTVAIHKSLCEQVLTQITPPGEEMKHVYKEPDEKTVRKSRVFRRVPLYFQQIGVHYIPIIVCTYEDMKVYLAHGDDKNVFRLDRDKDNIFYINSGLHPINITV